MALDVATLPLILYRKVHNHGACITLREHHTHSYLVLLLCHSYSIFFISNVFSTCIVIIDLYSAIIIISKLNLCQTFSLLSGFLEHTHAHALYTSIVYIDIIEAVSDQWTGLLDGLLE